jgi:hypothetical protein
MAPVGPLTGRDWDGDLAFTYKISVYASGVTFKYRSEVPEPTIALYAAIRLDRRQSCFYDTNDPKRSPRINPSRRPESYLALLHGCKCNHYLRVMDSSIRSTTKQKIATIAT